MNNNQKYWLTLLIFFVAGLILGTLAYHYLSEDFSSSSDLEYENSKLCYFLKVQTDLSNSCVDILNGLSDYQVSKSSYYNCSFEDFLK